MPLLVNIRQHQFEISREYLPGHVLTPGEAAALNQVLVENIRNNVYAWVVREVLKSGVLTSQQHSDLQTKINNYTDKYQFKVRPKYRPPTPLEATAKELAIQEAERWAQEMGVPLDDPTVKDMYARLSVHPDILDRARELVRSRQGIADNLLEGLI